MKKCIKIWDDIQKKYIYRRNEQQKEVNRIYTRKYNKDLVRRRLHDLKYFYSHPWAKTLNSIRSRCIYDKNSYYFKKGIRNFLTLEDIKYLWFRDKAYLMKKPSIDRIDNKKDYIINNCQFLEFKDNCIKARKK